MQNVLSFPGKNKTTDKNKPSRMSWWVRSPVGDRIRRWFAACLRRIGIMGTVREMQFYDDVSDQHVSIKCTTPGYVITINGRDYFFSLTGRKQGTGSGI